MEKLDKDEIQKEEIKKAVTKTSQFDNQITYSQLKITSSQSHKRGEQQNRKEN